MKILIVDDEIVQVEGMRKMINKLYPEVDVLKAFNGKQGLDILTQNEINIIFTDIKMPIMNGIEMMKVWRSWGKAAEKPPYFIIFSGFDEFTYAQQALRYGAIDYQLKPLDIYGISRMFERVIGKSEYKDKNNLNEPVSSDRLVEQINKYVLKHIDEKLSLEEVAMRFSYHPNYFSSLWRKKTKKSFSGYVQSLKMDKAKALLAETNLKVTNIALQIGYTDDKYFCRVFKKHFNITPQEFRRKNRLNEADYV